MKHLIFYYILLLTTVTFGQDLVINNCHIYQTKAKGQLIDYYVYKSSEEKKPILFFCQGSLPVPLFIQFGQDYHNASLSNFDLNFMSKHYHIVVVSKPHVPVVVPFEQLNSSYCYITDTTRQYSYPEEYVKHDYLDNYVIRAKKIIREVQKFPWVDKNNWVIAGHSQGAREAVAISSSTTKFTKVGLSGYDSKGRFESALRTIRKHAETEKITWEHADSLTAEALNEMQEIYNHPAGLKSEKSFQISSINELLKLKIPIYIFYGSHDVIADACDFLPFYFAENHKTNLTIKRYAHLEHNFFPVKENGEIDYENGKWKEVMNAFIQFVIQP